MAPYSATEWRRFFGSFLDPGYLPPPIFMIIGFCRFRSILNARNPRSSMSFVTVCDSRGMTTVRFVGPCKRYRLQSDSGLTTKGSVSYRLSSTLCCRNIVEKDTTRINAEHSDNVVRVNATIIANFLTCIISFTMAKKNLSQESHRNL